ncbi:thiamine pyrophosphate-binding protein [Streptantibioticus ferralitis]|uniref:Thiamine pyrophosphate-binding protein n=1 Tax=Streptantibioticus ferralitis TaxID=236510 RepID=A0ABT5YX06_9ACTN|nr:thiamine pyrophosphate-binding protein [Streptantibioticus ferralitis]MDF2256133.1 thiamine pyrophosphate-binding protein [Streptantibioticus ferralitis]
MTTYQRSLEPPARLLVDLLRDEGVDRVFGNPGTTELPLIREVAAAGDLPYVLALQEHSAVSMADGYARGTGRPSFVSLHAAGGLANGVIGMLNALRSGTPMVVLACQQDQRHLAQGPMLTGDLVAMAAPVAHCAEQVHHAQDLPVVMRRAFRRARTAPQGPVFVSVPTDVLSVPARLALPPRSPLPELGTAPEADRAAEVLIRARRPAIVAGDRVGQGGADAELRALAEVLGAVVYPQPMFDAVNADSEHPLTAWPLPPDNAVVHRVLAEHDSVLFAGVTIRPHHFRPQSAVPEEVTLVQLDTDPAQIGRNFPVEVGMVGAMRPTLAALAAEVRSRRRPEAAVEAVQRAARIGERLVARRLAWREQSRAAAAAAPMHHRAAVQAVADALPESAVVVEEAVSSGPALWRALRIRRPGDYHHTVGGGLGWGIGAAVGLQLAHPTRPVVAVVGDGSAMFGVQGLWSAAAQQAPIVVVVLNNAEYRAVREPADPEEAAGYPGIDLVRPAVQWPLLARSLGLDAVRVEHTARIAPAIADALRSRRPTVIEVPILGSAAERHPARTEADRRAGV